MLLPARSVLDRFTIYDRIFVAIDYDRFLSSNVFSNRSILIWLYLVYLLPFSTQFTQMHVGRCQMNGISIFILLRKSWRFILTVL